MLLEIGQKEVAPGTVVVTLAGKLMMGPEGEQVTALVDRLLGEGLKILIFDLSGVTMIDSTGIGRFIAAFNRVTATGGELRMAGATGHLYQSFHVSLLDQVFPFFPTVEEAIQG